MLNVKIVAHYSDGVYTPTLIDGNKLVCFMWALKKIGDRRGGSKYRRQADMFAALGARTAQRFRTPALQMARRNGSSGGGVFDPHPPAADSWHMKAGSKTNRALFPSNSDPQCVISQRQSPQLPCGFGSSTASKRMDLPFW